MKSISSRAIFHEGSALIIVLWSMLLLAFALSMAAEKTFLFVGDASIRFKRFQAGWLADSAFVALDRILKEEQEKLHEREESEKEFQQPLDFSRFRKQWHSKPEVFGGGAYYVEIRDEQGRLHWLKTPDFVWRNLFRMSSLEIETLEIWKDSLIDWQDADENRTLHGAESMDYESLPKDRRHAKNSCVTDFGELIWVMGGRRMLEAKVLTDASGRTESLISMTTLYGDGRVNVNSAPAALIAAVLNIPLERAQELIRIREGADRLEGTADDRFLNEIPSEILPVNDVRRGDPKNITTLASTVSSYFRIRGVGEFQGQRVVKEAVAVRDQSGLCLLENPRVVEEKGILLEEKYF